MPHEVAIVIAVIGGAVMFIAILRAAWPSRDDPPPPQKNADRPRIEPSLTPRPLTPLEAAQVGLRGQGVNQAQPQRRREEEEFFEEDWKFLRQQTPIRIRYHSAGAGEADRTVSVIGFSHVEPDSEWEPSHFIAHCHLRQASRTFAIHNVEEAFDLRDGIEINDLTDWLLAQPTKQKRRR